LRQRDFGVGFSDIMAQADSRGFPHPNDPVLENKEPAGRCRIVGAALHAPGAYQRDRK
jgi:hypothetical protein